MSTLRVHAAIVVTAFSVVFMWSANTHAASITVAATDAIFLAGRTDVTIAPAGIPPSGYPLLRNSPPGTQAESFPTAISAMPGNVFEFLASGTVNYNDEVTQSPPVFSPDGGFAVTIGNLAGISDYQGPGGALLGIFLDASNPASSIAPTTLNFSTIGTSFSTLHPGLGQVFFIGDGLTGTGTGSEQNFVAPTGATRLFIAVADAPGFSGPPGAYDDNAGSYHA
ncbi:MAG TPA: hypothetical protein VGN12_18970 [Pirellulales bacterium]